MYRKFSRSLLLLAGLAGACAQPTVYNWGDYDSGLYAYYKDSEKMDDLMAALNEAIQMGEVDSRVPPGMYAEYGYLLMVRGRRDEAVVYFNKEKSAWPESTVLMDKLIAAASAT